MQVLVVGAGVVGLAVARAAALAGADVIVAEAGAGIGTGISSRNSEVIHAGIYYPAGSARARLCAPSRRLLYDFCASHGVPHRKCGKLIVATREAELAGLEALQTQGRHNGVEGLEMIDAAAARRLEPALACAAALRSPETGIIDSHAFMTALRGDLEDHGGSIAFNTRIERLAPGKPGWKAGFGGTSRNGSISMPWSMRPGSGRSGSPARPTAIRPSGCRVWSLPRATISAWRAGRCSRG